jgi:hypothetical protein
MLGVAHALRKIVRALTADGACHEDVFVHK